MIDVTALSLTELAAAYRDGSLRPVEVTEAYLAKISVGDVYRLVTAERAREQARQAERLFADGIDVGPLQGIPVALKDLMDTAGDVTAAGSKVLAMGEPAAQDCPAAARLDAAGAVFLGKTNMTELAFSGVGLNPHFGTPGCALDASRIPGGSSSGSGVAVAAGLACVAIGSDTGGSVRIPAAFNGITGLKTTDKAIPTDGVVPLSTTLDTLGPLAKTPEDAWHVWCALASKPFKAFEVNHEERLRFLAPTNVLQEDLEPEVSRVFFGLCDALEAAGHEVVHEEVPLISEIPRLYAQSGSFASLESLALYEAMLASQGEMVDKRVSERILQFRDVPASQYIRLGFARDKLKALFWQTYRGYDGVLAPTVPILPPEIASLASDEAYFRVNGLCLRNTMIFNFLGGPAVSVPAGTASGGLSVGVMIATLPQRELRALTLGERVRTLVAD